MKTSALLLISLALAQAVTKPYRSPVLNLIGTDAINDVIKYHNYFYQFGVASIPDVVAEHQDGQNYYHVHASEGGVRSRGMKLAKEPAQLEFQIVPFLSKPTTHHHRIVANVSITFDDMQLVYGNVKVDIKDGVEPRKAFRKLPPKDAVTARAIIGKTQFHLQVEQRHYTGRENDAACMISIKVLAAEEFIVKDVTIHSKDPAMEKIIEVLANNFKAQLLTESYSVNVVASLLKDEAPKVFRYCQYVAEFPLP